MPDDESINGNLGDNDSDVQEEQYDLSNEVQESYKNNFQFGPLYFQTLKLVNGFEKTLKTNIQQFLQVQKMDQAKKAIEELQELKTMS